MASILDVSGLTKSFGANRVLRGIDLSIGPGELVGLMGPNGAGKSTLIKILAGVHHADSGTVQVDGMDATHLAGRDDVAFIHQDLGLIEDLTVADNFRLDRPIRRGRFFLDRRRERTKAVEALSAVQATIDPDVTVAELSAGERAMVAVARALEQGGRLIIVDEATSTLTPGDSRRLIAALRAAAAGGAAVVFVTHKLTETLEACDRIVMLSEGLIEVDQPVVAVDHEHLVEVLMASDARRSLGTDAAGPAVPSLEGGPTVVGHAAGDPVLVLEGVAGGLVESADLTLRSGEVVGVTGLAGSGLHDLGLLVAGRIKVSGGSMRPTRAGLRTALLPAHRETEGGFDDLPVRHNLTISSLSRWRRRLGLLSRRDEGHDAGEMHARLGVFPAGLELIFGTLSGGNKQKVIFGRLLLAGPDVLVLCEPTRGVDVATRRRLYQEIERACSDGAAVLVLTSDVEDLLAVAHRVGVITHGRIATYRDPRELSLTQWEAAL